jgi:hypothetical protein
VHRFHVRRLAPWALAVCLVIGTAASPAHADAPGREYGIGAACVFANLVYAPAKFLYATGGALVAGAAYAFSGGDLDVARPIVDASLRGDYVITPEHLRGERPVEFVGRSPAQRAMQRDPWAGGQGEPLDEGF